MKTYKYLLFDLDHTLWDYDRNSAETLHDLYHDYQLEDMGVKNKHDFISSFQLVNNRLWYLHDHGKISREYIRERRFATILEQFDIVDQELCYELSDEYLFRCPKKGNTLPAAHSTLDYLKGKYQMAIVTNGFLDIQKIKLDTSNLGHYFDHLVASDNFDCKKPSREIFDHTMKMLGGTHHEALMIGDNPESDIKGAQNAGIDHVYFNPHKVSHDHNPTFEIQHLEELTNFL